MKRIHLLLILAFAVLAALLLWRGQRIRDRETSLRQESPRLAGSEPRHSRLAGAADGGSRRTKRSRPQNQDHDPQRFISGMKELLNADEKDNEKRYESLCAYFRLNAEFLKNTSRQTDGEICNLLQAYDLGGRGRDLLFVYLQRLFVSDPEWAINRMGQAATPEGVLRPGKEILPPLGKHWAVIDDYWSSEYAHALGRWLDTAQATDRLKGLDSEVAQMRFDIAIITADTAGAILLFAKMTPDGQSQVISQIADAASSPDERLRLLQQASKAAAPPAFRQILQMVATQSGFEAARDLLASADLTPEHRDLAAAATAGAEIGPETPARAAWLLGSLQSNKKAAVSQFAALWTEGDYKGTIGWLTSLPPGSNRDAAIAGFAPVAARLDGASAVEWALTVNDPAQRDATLKTVSKSWNQQDPEAAAAYLHEKGLDIK